MWATSAQNCDYSKMGMCIKPEASASVALPFAPLFSTPPTFVLAIDNLDDQDIQDMLNLDDALRAPADNEPASAVAWWLEYDNSTLNRDDSQEREYYAWALESNSTNDIGGNDGGCENLLGAECVSDLKNLFTGLDGGLDGGFAGALAGLFRTPPARINCPTVLWHHGDGRSSAFGGAVRPLWWGGAQWFARMSDKFLWTSEPGPSGNSSSTHGVRQMRYRSFEEQKGIAVVAFSMGQSLVGGGRDNTTINVACLRVGEAPKQGTGASPSGNGAGTKTAAASTVVLGILAAVWAFVA